MREIGIMEPGAAAAVREGDHTAAPGSISDADTIIPEQPMGKRAQRGRVLAALAEDSWVPSSSGTLSITCNSDSWGPGALSYTPGHYPRVHDKITPAQGA